MASTLCCWKPCWIGSAIAGPVTGCDLGERRIHAKPREDGSERKRARLAQRDSPVSAGLVLAEAVMFHPGRTRYNYRRAKTRQNSGEEAWIY